MCEKFHIGEIATYNGQNVQVVSFVYLGINVKDKFFVIVRTQDGVKHKVPVILLSKLNNNTIKNIRWYKNGKFTNNDSK